jgi:hypothetical protein
MTATSRDSFPRKVIRALAHRVGHLCSNPSCQASTGGPHHDPEKSINVGVAAHITAASVGGPRFNPCISTGERGSASNGIWLCQTCAKLIDSDVVRYPAPLLREWKAIAEQEAERRIGQTNSNQTSAPRSPQPDGSPRGLVIHNEGSIGVARVDNVAIVGTPPPDAFAMVCTVGNIGELSISNSKIIFLNNDNVGEHEE